ncbi:DUF4236 domain-containing protein [Agathobaculum sp.]|uniref:DUF4236 domain-containing protein n=1 Tax=Agathobaculum sp. TaxID=2048138 RepID=UPI003AB22FEA
MGFRFRKSFKIAPGVRVNVGKKSVGISAGVKGARVSVNSSGRKTTTVGIPGTGLSYQKTEKIGGHAATDKHDQTAPEYTPTVDLPPIDPQPPRPPRTPKGILTLLKVLAVLLIAMSLTLTLASVVGGFIGTAIGCFILYYRRTRIAWNGDKPPRCRWMVVVAVLFVLLAVGGKTSPDPAADATAEQTVQAEQAAAEKAEAEKATAEKAAKEQAEKEAAEKAAAEKAAKEQAEKEAAEKAAAEQAAAAAAAQTAQEQAAAQQQGETVYITPSGKRWHRSARCAGDNAIAVTMDQVGNRTPCKKCA